MMIVQKITVPGQEEHWTPLFNGKDLTGWYTFLQKHGKNHDPDRVVTIENGAIHLYKHAPEGSTVVMGYISTEKEYGNYHIRFQYRWGTKKFQPRLKMKRDAGFYYHILGPDAVWPRALQYQVEETDVGDLIALHGFQLDTWVSARTLDADIPTYQDPEQGGKRRVLGGKGIAYERRLPGDFEVDGWNTAEVVARGPSTVHILNGRVVSRGNNIRLRESQADEKTKPITRGRIALEIEAAEIFFRNVEIRLLDETEATGKGK
jgi:3-keto-disaccharide hydrolase